MSFHGELAISSPPAASFNKQRRALEHQFAGCDGEGLVRPGAVLVSGYDTEESALADPVLLIEILSPSYQAETWANVWAYATIPSVQEILVLKTASPAPSRRAPPRSCAVGGVRTAMIKSCLSGSLPIP